jgi:protein-disulfide isomerase
VTSGTQAKRKRKAQQPPPVRAKGSTGRRRQASPRVLIGAGVVVVLVVVAVVLGVVLSGGSSKTKAPARGSLVNALPGAADVQHLLQGIPQQGNRLGSPSAPVTMVEYIDLQCPYCQQFETEVMPTLVSRYVRPGKLKIESRIVGFIGPDSERGRLAALAAGKQNRLFNFAQLLYLNQGTENTGWLSDGMVTSAAASIPGLDVPRLLADRNAAAPKQQARTIDSQAIADKVSGTPTILVGKSGSTPQQVQLTSPTDLQSVAAAIAAVRS